MYRRTFLFWTVLLLPFLGFGQLSLGSKDIYEANECAEVAAQHETIAILPFEVSLVLKPNKRKKLTQAEFNALLVEDARAVQELLYEYLLKRVQQKELGLQIQDIYATNSRLLELGVVPGEIFKYSRKELADRLGVDAVISGKLRTNRPLSDRQNVISASVFSSLGDIVEGVTDISLYDARSGILLWKYENKIKKKYTKGVESVYEKLLERAGKSLPYFQR